MSTSTLIDDIVAFGYAAPSSIIWDGKLHRFATNSEKRHSKDGWYVAHDDHRGKAAAYGSWRDNVQRTWSNGTGRKLTRDELEEIGRQRDEAKAQAEKARAATAIRAQRIYAKASDSGSSEYLDRKNLETPEGCKYVSDLDAVAFGFKPKNPWKISGLIIPMQDASGKIVNLQIIADGLDKKLFMPESTTTGAFHIIGGKPTRAVVIAEGIATAAAILPHSHCPVAVAFSAGNLPSVARIMRLKFPTAEIIIAADGDKAGREYAEKAVSGLEGKSRVISAPDGQDFYDAPFPDLDPCMSRQDLLDKLIVKITDDGGQGKILPRMHNYLQIMAHAEEFAGKCAYNEFAEQSAYDGKPLTDSTITGVQALIEKHWISDKVASTDIDRAIRRVSESNPFHPVRDYLLSTKWDGVERVDSFFPDHLGTAESPYYSGAARCLFMGAVRRIFHPGCQMDSMVVLESPQGLGKSKLWETLAGEWYLDQTASIDSVDFFIAMRGKWFVDLGELDQFQKAEITRVKQVITLRNDDYRAKYARDNERKPRQSIFVGGTNSHEWISDHTGGRRFLPIAMGSEPVDIPRLAAVRDQLFAEAVHHMQAGDWLDWWKVPDAELQQERRMAEDIWTDPIQRYLSESQPAQIQTIEILTIVVKKHMDQCTRADAIRVGKIMHRLGWVYKDFRRGMGKYRAYVPPS